LSKTMGVEAAVALNRFLYYGSGTRDIHSDLALLDEHGVAVAEEAVVFLNGAVVSAADQLVAAERADQDEQGAARQVKVGQQGIDSAEGKWRADEKLGLAGKWADFAAGGGRF